MRSRPILLAAPSFIVLVAGAIVALTTQSRETAVSQTAMRLLGIACIMVAGLGFLAWLSQLRMTAESRREVLRAVTQLRTVRLPNLMPGSEPSSRHETAEYEPFHLGTSQEDVDLAKELDQLQEAVLATSVAQLAGSRRGVSDLVTNLARRSQGLLDRQLDVIDRLEAQEEDPHRLDELFALDHLATRMRRNAESLLVLAGADSSRRRGGSVSMIDILRVAMGEIEDYKHVELRDVQDGVLPAQTALDLAHLISELLENGAHFSPPQSPVVVTGATQANGSYAISIIDQGIGMTADQLATANAVLANPHSLALGATRSLGFIVVGRLAARVDASVELNSTAGAGVSALITISAATLAKAPSGSETAPTQVATTQVATTGQRVVPATAPTPPTTALEQADPEADTAASQAPDLPLAATADNSEALSRLLGIAEPTPSTPEQLFEGPTDDGIPPRWAQHDPQTDPVTPPAESNPHEGPEPAPQPWVPPSFEDSAKDMGPADQVVQDSVPAPTPDRATSLSDAIGGPGNFDQAFERLLKEDPSPTSSGLTRRPKPTGETHEQEAPRIAQSNRTPEEIRTMLARYRGGLQGTEPAAKTTPVAEQTLPEQTEPGQPQPEQPLPEQTLPEQTLPEQTLPEQTEPEQTEPEQPQPEQPLPRSFGGSAFASDPFAADPFGSGDQS